MRAEERVLLLLYGRAGHWDLQELASQAGPPPARMDIQALRRVLKSLADRGHRLESHGALGVRLVRPAALDPCLIEHELHTRRVGRSVLCFQQVASTNDVAMASVAQGNSDGLVILAESQSAGRGRRGRTWVSPPGANVLMSVLLEGAAPGQAPLPAEPLTIAAGLAVAEAAEDAYVLSCRLKWPNDVLLDGMKVAGVLVETGFGPASPVAGTRSRRAAAGIGIGVNVNAAPPRERIGQPATCLADAAGHPLERIELIRSLLRRLDAWTAEIAAGRLGQLRQAWLDRSDMINCRLTAVSAGRTYVGRVMDVSPMEGLHLCCDDGRHVHLPAASTTLSV